MGSSGSSTGQDPPKGTSEPAAQTLPFSRVVDFTLCLEIVAGKKTRDCVICKDGWDRAEVGHRINFTYGEGGAIKTVITDVKKFPSAAGALGAGEVGEFIPGAADIESALKYFQFSANDEAKFGVVSVQFSIIREDGITYEDHFTQ